MKKIILKFVLLTVFLVVTFLTGVHFGGRGKWPIAPTHTFHSMTLGDQVYISVAGEMIATDFISALTPMTIKLLCDGYGKGVTCIMAEYSIFFGQGSLEIYEFSGDQLKYWDDSGNLKIVSESANYTRVIDVSVKSKTMTDTYNFKNGEVGTMRMIDPYKEKSLSKI